MSFDGKITAAIVLAVAIEIVAALLWAGAASARLEAVELRLMEQRPVAERLARLEAQMGQAQASLSRIEARLEQRP